MEGMRDTMGEDPPVSEALVDAEGPPVLPPRRARPPLGIVLIYAYYVFILGVLVVVLLLSLFLPVVPPMFLFFIIAGTLLFAALLMAISRRRPGAWLAVVGLQVVLTASVLSRHASSAYPEAFLPRPWATLVHLGVSALIIGYMFTGRARDWFGLPR